MTHQESNDEKTQKSGDATRIGLSTEFQHGEMVGGRYQVISRLGKGGMGLVYRVKQILLNKEFALKTIDKGCMSDMAVRRFQQEARTSFSLHHPNIIAVNDFGVLDDQTPFLVMELVNGETLGELLKTGCLTLEQAVPIFLQVCAGLEYAHECGIVHRDIKPNNIMLRKGLPPGAEGRIQILDFGIAKFTEREGGEIQALTRTGEIFGSPLYMSPEQCAGQTIDQRADVYSVGCVLFESLTGTPPFMGENALSTMMKHQTEPAVTLKQASLGSEFPQAIEDIVATMLAKSPDARYQNLGMVAHDLRALKRGESISHTTGPVQPVRREATISMGRNSFYALLVGVVVVATLIAWFSGYLGGSSFVQPPTKPSPGESVSGLAPLETKDVPADEELKKQLARSSSTNKFAVRNTKLSDTSFELIANATWINVLALNGCEFDNENLGKLARLRLLKIDLGESTFNDIGAKRLSKCKELTHISANNTSKSDEGMGENLSDDGVGDLATIKTLQVLEIAGANITDKALIQLGRSKELVSLELRAVKRITDRGLSALEQTQLGLLDLSSTNIDDQGMVYLAKMHRLGTVGLNETNVTIRGIEKLCRGCKTIFKVVLIHCPGIGPKDIQRLRTDFPKIEFVDKNDKNSQSPG